MGIEKDFKVKNGLIVGETLTAPNATIANLEVTANTEFTSTGAIKLPAGTAAQRPSGTAGQLRFNSELQQFEGFNGTSWGSIGGGGGSSVQWVLVSESYTAISGEAILTDTSAGPITITLPADPAFGGIVSVADGADWSINPVTINRNGNTIENDTENFLLDIRNVKVDFVYDGSTWQVYANVGAQQSSPNDILIQTTALSIALG